jgi:hypothetical protein
MMQTSHDCRRLAILPNLSVDAGDPRNARYLEPLSNAGYEQDARFIADNLRQTEVSDRLRRAEAAGLPEPTDAELDPIFEDAQYLIDARRIVSDARYWLLRVPEIPDGADLLYIVENMESYLINTVRARRGFVR